MQYLLIIIFLLFIFSCLRLWHVHRLIRQWSEAVKSLPEHIRTKNMELILNITLNYNYPLQLDKWNMESFIYIPENENEKATWKMYYNILYQHKLNVLRERKPVKTSDPSGRDLATTLPAV